MKVLFISNRPGQAGTSSNLIAMATGLSLSDNRVVMIEGIQQRRPFGGLLDQAVAPIRQGGLAVQQDVGIDALIRLIKSEPVTKELIQDCLVSIYQDKLQLLPSTRQYNEEMYQTTIRPMLVYCINAVNEYQDYVLIDGGTVHQAEELSLIKQADVVVLNLSQNITGLEEIRKMKSIQGKKLFYLVGNYDEMSKYHLKYLCKHYHLPSKHTAVIPYEVSYKDAFSDGCAAQQILQVAAVRKGEDVYPFIREIRKAVYKFLICTQKEREGVS